MKKPDSLVHYLTILPQMQSLGMYCTTVGYQTVAPHTPYPPVGPHPEGYYFRKSYGRRLPEYQLVYIEKGAGWFQSEHCPRTQVMPGSMMILFPGEWHDYQPDPGIGWTEHWVGFRLNTVQTISLGISKEMPIVSLPQTTEVVALFDELMRAAEHEQEGYQRLCTGITLHLLGLACYMQEQRKVSNYVTIDLINRARAIMRNNVGKNMSPEQIAAELGVGYSWFRQTFREYVGAAPAQYQQQLRVQRAEFLLSDPTKSVSDIAYELGFANPNQFSTFFRQHKGTTPLQYRHSNYGPKTM